MKLYETAMTPSCKRVSIFLKEIGGEVERVALNVREGDNLSESFKQKKREWQSAITGARRWHNDL